MAHSTRQPAIDSNCVLDDSSNTVRTTPVAASATRTVAVLWSRAVDTKARRAPSGLQIQSRTATSSPSIARW